MTRELQAIRAKALAARVKDRKEAEVIERKIATGELRAEKAVDTRGTFRLWTRRSR